MALRCLTYRGYQYDMETGLYYLQSRYYNPTYGRFLNLDLYIDTDWYGFGTNVFAYCENDCVNCVDPAGYWGGKIHRKYTEKWANMFGFSKIESRIIAESNQEMDSISNHAMWKKNQHIHFNTMNSPWDSREIFAFTHILLAMALWESAYTEYVEEITKIHTVPQSPGHRDALIYELNVYRKIAIELLGSGLYALQDIEGHGNIGENEVYKQHVISSGGRNIHKADKIDYSWTDYSKTKLKLDSLLKKRYNKTKKDTEEYLMAFENFRKDLYNDNGWSRYFTWEFYRLS